ncbi:uncharacterized protein LTR77_001166 [Saxophila tyrrhenica]|uniref:Uncharacterized protein n=1 Tax=Saxophila tyrrhenica TaxID=1690608 RepID=A0AAV9PMU1_9PEZI|nr:hypothetical protein LTR77_001166 [Saxophila tyrrhenica]
MQSFQRATARSARTIRPRPQQQSRRHASGGDTFGGTTKNENLGPGFYVTLAAFPASFAIFKLTQGDDAVFTRWIRDTYNSYAVKWAQRNDLHVQALEQAAADKVLFLNESVRGPHRHVELRFPEQLNMGSPWNVSAGHGGANIDEAIAKFQKDNYEAQERKMQQVRENKVPKEQPFTTLAGSNAKAPAVNSATPAGD